MDGPTRGGMPPGLTTSIAGPDRSTRHTGPCVFSRTLTTDCCSERVKRYIHTVALMPFGGGLPVNTYSPSYPGTETNCAQFWRSAVVMLRSWLTCFAGRRRPLDPGKSSGLFDA